MGKSRGGGSRFVWVFVLFVIVWDGWVGVWLGFVGGVRWRWLWGCFLG